MHTASGINARLGLKEQGLVSESTEALWFRVRVVVPRLGVTATGNVALRRPRSRPPPPAVTGTGTGRLSLNVRSPSAAPRLGYPIADARGPLFEVALE